MPPTPRPPSETPLHLSTASTPKSPHSGSKSVTFSNCRHDTARSLPSRPYPSDPDITYHSDPGITDFSARSPKEVAFDFERTARERDKFHGYYSEPDAKYFEIDYDFLKRLSALAERDLERRRRAKRARSAGRPRARKASDGNDSSLYEKLVDSYVIETESEASKYQERRPLERHEARRNSDRKKSTEWSVPFERLGESRRSEKSAPPSRRSSVHSAKSVSFVDNPQPESPSNYTGKSFTNDLKRFLLKPSSSRFSLKEKFLGGLRISCDDRERPRRRRAPSIGLIKGLWKSL